MDYQKNITNDLAEAYNSIYESQEINEEQIIEFFNTWVDDLLNEGYDLSDYTYDELYEYYINESAVGQGLKTIAGIAGRALQTAWRGTPKPLKNSTYVHGGKQSTKELLAKIGRITPPVVTLGVLDQIGTGGAGREWLGSGIQALRDLGHKIPKPSNYKDSSDYERDPYNLKRESFDTFDIIKCHLMNENYVNNEEDALIIMSNMSDEWKEEILENYI